MQPRIIPRWPTSRRQSRTASLEHRLAHLHDQTLGLPQRAVAALFALGIGARGGISRGTGGLDAALIEFSELGAPEELVAATADCCGTYA